MILVSACLAGMCCRYDGGTKKIPLIEKLVNEGKALPICPEKTKLVFERLEEEV